MSGKWRLPGSNPRRPVYEAGALSTRPQSPCNTFENNRFYNTFPVATKTPSLIIFMRPTRSEKIGYLTGRLRRSWLPDPPQSQPPRRLVTRYLLEGNQKKWDSAFAEEPRRLVTWDQRLPASQVTSLCGASVDAQVTKSQGTKFSGDGGD